MSQTELITTAPKEFTELDIEERGRQLLRSIGCLELAQVLRVQWYGRLRSTAGMAHYQKSLVLLNPRLRDFGKVEVETTLRHELAHLVAKYRAGRRRIAPHGEEWRCACRDLGLPDERRCHNLPLPRRVVSRRYLYFCPSCKMEVRRVRPFRYRVACLECCRRSNRGSYDERFQLLLQKSAGQAASGN